MMSDIMNEKTRLRHEVLKRRDALTPSEREAKSAQICTRLHEHLDAFLARITPDTHTAQANGILQDKKVAVYASMKSEVSLDSFILEAYSQGAALYFPCMTKTEKSEGSTPTITARSMVFREIPQDCYLAHRKGNTCAAPFMDNPVKSFAPDDSSLAKFAPLDPHEVDVVVVPMVAFDSGFSRLGYGGGNYDNFLAELPGDTCVVGVAFSEQKVEEIPLEAHDLPLPHIVHT